MTETTILAVPGKKINLPISTLDDLSQKVSNVYHVKLISNCSMMTLEPNLCQTNQSHSMLNVEMKQMWCLKVFIQVNLCTNFM